MNSNYDRYSTMPAVIAEKKENEIENQRMREIYKANEFIRDFTFNLTASQFRLANYLIAYAYLENENLEFIVDIKRYCEICGIDANNGYNYIQIKSDIKVLRNKSVWKPIFGDNTGAIATMSIIEKSRIYPSSGKIWIRLDEDLKPYIVDLAKRYERDGKLFTVYLFAYTLNMKSIYSMRLYELLQSWSPKAYPDYRERYWRISDLQQILNSNYERYQDFRRFVIEKAVAEINEYSDINVEWEPVKEGRNYEFINFTFRLKSSSDLLDTQIKNNAILCSLANRPPMSQNIPKQTKIPGLETMPEPPDPEQPKKKRGRPRKK